MICYLIGLGVKAYGKIDRFIPCIVGVCGGILGVAAMFVMRSFIAEDYITAVAVGIVSGLASTGADQITKQLFEGTDR